MSWLGKKNDYFVVKDKGVLGGLFVEILVDLREVKAQGFQLSENCPYGREVDEKIGPMKKNLRDAWLLWCYYETLGSYAGINGRTVKDLKKSVVFGALCLGLASSCPNAFFGPNDFWVNRKWDLFRLKKPVEKKG